MVSNHHEGMRVSYIGDGSDGRILGERGQILAITGRAAHVKWADSSITLVDLNDLGKLATPTRTAAVTPVDDLADSLEVGPVVAVGMRGVFEAEGSGGVLRALAATGQLSRFASIAEDVRTFTERQVREDPDVRRVTAQLDPEEGDELVSVATLALLRDAFGTADGD